MCGMWAEAAARDRVERAGAAQTRLRYRHADLSELPRLRAQERCVDARAPEPRKGAGPAAHPPLKGRAHEPRIVFSNALFPSLWHATRPLLSVPQTSGRSRLQRPCASGRLNSHGWAASGPLYGASGPGPDPSPGTNSHRTVCVRARLAAPGHGPAPEAVPGLVGRVRACKREPFLRCRTARWRAAASTVGLQPHVSEDLLDHRLLHEGRNDLALATEVWAMLQVELEHAGVAWPSSAAPGGGVHNSPRNRRVAQPARSLRPLAEPAARATWRSVPVRRGVSPNCAGVPDCAQSTQLTKIARKSFTLVNVGPGVTRSPSGLKKL